MYFLASTRAAAYWLSVLALAITLLSCSKKEEAQSPTARLKGTWVLEQRSGGIAGRTTYADPNNPEELTFDGKSTVRSLRDGQVNVWNYAVARRVTSTSATEQDVLLYSAPKISFVPEIIVQLDQKTLVLANDIADGYTARYRAK